MSEHSLETESSSQHELLESVQKEIISLQEQIAEQDKYINSLFGAVLQLQEIIKKLAPLEKEEKNEK